MSNTMMVGIRAAGSRSGRTTNAESVAPSRVLIITSPPKAKPEKTSRARKPDEDVMRMLTSVSSPLHVHHRPYPRPHPHRGTADPCAGEGIAAGSGRFSPFTGSPGRWRGADPGL